jgi:hypothetical protein
MGRLLSRAATALVACLVACLGAGLVACSGAPDEAPPPAPVVETSPTESEEPASLGPAPLAASPACGAPGAHVILKVGNTPDGRKPNCLRIQDFTVRFGRAHPSKVLQAGDTYDGYCGLDVLVPEGADSGPVTVTAGKDLFESETAFRPCP